MEEKKNIHINPRQRAVALKYSPGDTAPRVVAKGKGYIAEKIIEHGEKSDVTIYQDAKLAEELTSLELGNNIPPELYEVVAQVLVFIDRLDRMEAHRHEHKQSQSY